jgi:Regulator of chromosome condensation (RCC1) repeat/PASTA domain
MKTGIIARLYLARGKEREMELSRGPRSLLLLCVLLALGVGLFLSVGAGQATAAVRPIAWGCGGGPALDSGQCSVPGGLSGATAIAAGFSHSLAVKGDGTVVAWGCRHDNFGQCNVLDGLAGVTAVVAQNFHSLALKNDGTVVAWGCGESPVRPQCSVPGGLSGVSAIAGGNEHGVALKSDGTVVAWGCLVASANVGQCSVPGGLAGVTAISADDSHSLALKSDGTVVAWGCGAGGGFQADFGQCNVPGGLSAVTAIAAGNRHSLALKSDGTVVAWGCGAGGGFPADFGQCNVPGGLSAVTAIAAGEHHSLALKSDGTVVAWGCRVLNLGECGVPNGLCHATAIAAAAYHSLALAELCQSINFPSLPDTTYGAADFSVGAAASSRLPVSFAASGDCTLSGALLHLTGAGSCTVTASQAGNADYNAAPDVTRAFAIAKAGQSITFGALANKRYGAPDFRVSATASSGLAVSFAARGKCTLRGAMVHLTGAGSCTVTASQAGDANYNAAPDVSRTFTIAPAPCRVPKVVGSRLASARRTLAKRHCRTGKLGYAYSRTRKKGIVVAQSRRPGKVLPGRSKINLLVSRGRRR